MMSQSPQWPDGPAQPDQSPGNGSPLSRLARSRRELTAVTIITGVLIVALLGMLALALSSNAHGAQAQNGQTQNGQIANAGGAQTATASNNSGAGNGASSGRSTPTAGGGSSGEGGTHPTPTPSRGSATPTPTSDIPVVGGCCLTFSPYVHQVVSHATLSGTSVGPVVATCPAGEIALSGGWVLSHSSGAAIARSTRTGKGSWAVYVNHPSSVTVTAYAECLANASGATIAERVAYVSLPARHAIRGSVNCNPGEVVVGGGFATQTGVDVNDMSPYGAPATGWGSEAENDGNSSAYWLIYAECLTYRGVYGIEIASQPLHVAAGSTGSATSTACPTGMYVSGGGYTAFGFVYFMSASGNGTTWTVFLYANLGPDQTLYSKAICLGFS